jgi:hypothetical protein
MRLKDEDEGKCINVIKVKLFLGIPSSAIREIALLKVLKHENIMSIEEIQHDQENLFIVTEYCTMDLKVLVLTVQ